MALQELPNGMQYYSISEDLGEWMTQVYEVITPFNIGIFVVITVIVVSIMVFMILYMARKKLEMATR